MYNNNHIVPRAYFAQKLATEGIVCTIDRGKPSASFY